MLGNIGFNGASLEEVDPNLLSVWDGITQNGSI
jgi:hypothetical protein